MKIHSYCFAAILIGCLFQSGQFEQPCFAAPPEFNAQTSSVANEITNFTGKLKGMRRGVVIVEKEDGTEAYVMPPDSISSFQFIAKATPAFLQRGMMIRFVGNFTANGAATAPITKITLFQPVNLRSLQGRAKQQFTPGIHADPGVDKRNPPAVAKMTIVGALIGLTPNGVLAVQAGKTALQVPVNADTQLEVRYNNLNLALEGDRVVVAGFYQPPNENQVKAERITITTDRVYGEYKPDTKKKSRRKRGKKDDDEKDADAKDGAAKGADDKGDDKQDSE